MLKDLPFSILLTQGGDTRQQSVLNGLYALPAECEYVAVHDAARPFVTRNILKKTLESAVEYGSGVACTRVTDTIKRVDDDGRVMTLNRNELRAVQTPQVFAADLLKAALQSAITDGAAITDDCSAVERMGKEVHLTAGSEENIKITTPEDFYTMRAILEAKENAQIYGMDEK